MFIRSSLGEPITNLENHTQKICRNKVKLRQLRTQPLAQLLMNNFCPNASVLLTPPSQWLYRISTILRAFHYFLKILNLGRSSDISIRLCASVQFSGSKEVRCALSLAQLFIYFILSYFNETFLSRYSQDSHALKSWVGF